MSPKSSSSPKSSQKSPAAAGSYKPSNVAVTLASDPKQSPRSPKTPKTPKSPSSGSVNIDFAKERELARQQVAVKAAKKKAEDEAKVAAAQAKELTAQEKAELAKHRAEAKAAAAAKKAASEATDRALEVRTPRRDPRAVREA